mgnify:CR=1 FL=1
MEREEIKKILPHREPMLLIDRVEKKDEKTALGEYTIKGDEWFLKGHFPGKPVVPGVILCEMMAQACCILIAGDIKGKTPYFTGINKVKFKNKVLPGDTFKIECVMLRQKGPFYFAQVKGYTSGKTAVSGELSFALIDG